MAKFYDTLIWEYIKKPWIRWLSLDKLAIRDFEYKMISYDSITNKKKIDFINIDIKNASIYSGEDVYITNKLFINQKNDKNINNDILDNIEFPLLQVIKEMEITWVKINPDKLSEIWKLIEKQLIFLKKSIYEKSNEEFNINSPKQVWEILFEKLALPKWKKTKTGYSVSADILWELAHEYPIAQDIVDYRHFSKLLSTYIVWLTEIMDGNNLLHTSYNQTVTSTWRLSSTNPNLQNIPSSDWIAGTIREAFISRFDNWKIIAIDYSQVEVRLLAIMSEDKNLLDAFKSGIDIHHKTAELIFWKSEISSSERKIAKAVNFWVIYWISAFWLSKMIDISIKEWNTYIKKFYESYPKVRIFLDNTIKFCEKNWYVETLYKRRRYINWINDSNKMIKSWAQREAINMPIQWTSADIIKIAMIESNQFIKNNNLKSKLIMQVHDELVFDTYPWEEKEIEKWIINIMENILKGYDIKLIADIWIWDNWKQAK